MSVFFMTRVVIIVMVADMTFVRFEFIVLALAA